MATSYRNPATITETEEESYFSYPGEKSIQEIKDEILRKQGYKSKLYFPAPMSENQKMINRLFERANKDTSGNLKLRLDNLEELTKIQNKILEEKKTAEILEGKTFTQKQQDYIDDVILSKELNDKFFTYDDLTQIKEFIKSGSEVGKDAMRVVKNYLNTFSGPLIPNRPTALTGSPSGPPPPPGGDFEPNTEEFKKDPLLFNLLRLSQKNTYQKVIETDLLYRRSREARIFKQATLKNEMDKGNAYTAARLKNREDDIINRVVQNVTLKQIKGKGQRIIAPMNSVSFDMVVGYP